MVEKSVSKSVSKLLYFWGFLAKNERTAVASTHLSLWDDDFSTSHFTSRAPPGTTTRGWRDENLAQIARDANAWMRKSSLIWTCTLLAGTIARSSDSILYTAAKIAFFFSLSESLCAVHPICLSKSRQSRRDANKGIRKTRAKRSNKNLSKTKVTYNSFGSKRRVKIKERRDIDAGTYRVNKRRN